MNLNDVAAALEEKLNTIPGMRAFGEIPPSINPPTAVIGMGSGGFDDFDDNSSCEFGVFVLVSAADSKRSQKAIRDFCSATGTLSIKAAVEQDNHDLLLAGVSTGVTVHCRDWDAPIEVTLGGTSYIGIEFHLAITE